MITAFLSHPYCQRHDMGPDHPESPLRLDAIRAQLMRSGVLQHAMQADAREATEEQLQRVHPEAHLARLEQASPQEGHASIDADTLMNSDSLQAARLAAGAVPTPQLELVVHVEAREHRPLRLVDRRHQRRKLGVLELVAPHQRRPAELPVS